MTRACFPLPCPRCTERERDRAVEARREAGRIRTAAYDRTAAWHSYFERGLMRQQLQLVSTRTTLTEMAGVNEDDLVDFGGGVILSVGRTRYPWWRRLMWHITRSR